MRMLNYLLLPVHNPQASANLYTRLLGSKPVESSEAFVLYVLPNGIKVGLWLSSDIEPKPATPGGIEIAFTEQSREAVLNTYNEWKELGLKVLQEPTDMPFGFTFVVEDPDGHRLRPFVLAEKPR